MRAELAEAGDILAGVERTARGARVSVYLVGGALRDLYLGRPLRDVDLALETGPQDFVHVTTELQRHGWKLLARHLRFETATLVSPAGRRVDLAATRRETYPAPAALPVVQVTASIREDLGRRDFSIHAMARRVCDGGTLGPLLDPFHGAEDLHKKTVRLLHDRSLVDDPTRAFRAARYAARLGFHLERSFERRLTVARAEGAFSALSPDRLRRSLDEVIQEDAAARGLKLLREHQLLDDVLAGWSGSPPEGWAVEAAERGEARWAAMIAPLGPGLRRRLAERLAFSRRLRRAAGVMDARG